MTFKHYTSTGILLFILIGMAYSQIKMPTFDVELKIHQNLIPGEVHENLVQGSGQNNGDLELVETTNLYAGTHVQLGQYIAIGAFYSRSFRGVAKARFNESNLKYDGLTLQKGLDLRLSTGRAKNWRQYLVIQYSTLEILQDNESYRLADKTNTFGASLGITRRLSNRLYLNVIELGANFLTSRIFWFGDSDADIYLNVKAGLGYNIGKRK